MAILTFLHCGEIVKNSTVQGIPTPAGDIWWIRLHTCWNLFTWGPPSPVLTSGDYWSIYSWQEGSTHPTGMFSFYVYKCISENLQVQFKIFSHRQLMEFSLNGTWIHWIQEIWKITEAWIGVNLKILSLTCDCWCCGSILVSYTRGGWVAGSSPFTVMTNILSLNSANSVKTLRENSNVSDMNDKLHRNKTVQYENSGNLPIQSPITETDFNSNSCNLCFKRFVAPGCKLSLFEHFNLCCHNIWDKHFIFFLMHEPSNVVLM